MLVEWELFGRSQPVKRGFLVVKCLLRLVVRRLQFSRLPASTRRSSSKRASVQCRLNGVSVCNERVQGGQCVYQTKGMRNQCRSVGGVCQVVLRSCCVGACVSPRRARARVSQQWVAKSSKQEGNTEATRNGASEPRAACLSGSRPGGQAGRGWYLFETRSDGGMRRLRIDELGQAKRCLCEEMEIQYYCKRQYGRGGGKPASEWTGGMDDATRSTICGMAQQQQQQQQESREEAMRVCLSVQTAADC